MRILIDGDLVQSSIPSLESRLRQAFLYIYFALIVILLFMIFLRM